MLTNAAAKKYPKLVDQYRKYYNLHWGQTVFGAASRTLQRIVRLATPFEGKERYGGDERKRKSHEFHYQRHPRYAEVAVSSGSRLGGYPLKYISDALTKVVDYYKEPAKTAQVVGHLKRTSGWGQGTWWDYTKHKHASAFPQYRTGYHIRARKNKSSQMPNRRGYYTGSYRRKYTGRRRPYRRKSYTRNNRQGGYLNMKRRGFNVPNEAKFGDFELVNEAFTTTWAAKNPTTVNCISAIAQGDGPSNRDGRVYYIKSLHIKGSICVPALQGQAAPASDVIARICIVWDKSTNGAEVVATQVMDGGQTDDHFAFRNLEHSNRFIVLWDRTFHIVLDSTSEGGADFFANGQQEVLWAYHHEFKKPMKVVCTSVDTLGIVANMSKNSLSVIGVASDATPLLSYQARIRFVG